MTHQLLPLLNLSALIHKTVIIQSNRLCYCKAPVIYCNYFNGIVFDYGKQLLSSTLIIYLPSPPFLSFVTTFCVYLLYLFFILYVLQRLICASE